MRARAIGKVLSASLVVAGLGWAAAGERRAASATDALQSAAHELHDTRDAPDSVALAAVPRSRMTHARAPARGKTEPQRATTLPIVAPRRLPRSLRDVELNSRQRAWLDQLTPMQRSIYEYKLGLLDRMRACVGELGDVRGKVSAFLHFRVDPATGVSEALEPEVLDSSLPEASDTAVLRCVRDAHAGSELDLRGESLRDGGFHWATDIVFPLDEDPAYELFALTDDGEEEETE